MLYEAVWRGHSEIVKMLADAGANVDATDAENNPMLYTATWRDKLEALRVLVNAGADIDARDAEDEPMLYTATWRDKLEAQSGYLSPPAPTWTPGIQTTTRCCTPLSGRTRSRLCGFSWMREQTSMRGGPMESPFSTWRGGGDTRRSSRFWSTQAPKNSANP